MYANADFIKQAAQVVPLKLDAEKEGKDLAKKYGVRGYPTILFVDADGAVMGRIGGYEPAEQFTADLNKQVTAYKEFPNLEAALRANPAEGETNAKMAGILAGRGKVKEAEECLAKAEKAKYKGASLAPAYNAVGDVYQQGEGGKPDLKKAIGLFKKADAAATNPKDRSYAKISLVYCHYMAGDKDAAKKACNDLIKMKDADTEYVKMAKELLKQLGG